MSIPHYINDDKSDMRGIKPGPSTAELKRFPARSARRGRVGRVRACNHPLKDKES